MRRLPPGGTALNVHHRRITSASAVPLGVWWVTLVGGRLLLDFGDELASRHAQRPGQPQERRDRRLTLAGLHPRDERTVDAARVGQVLLREAARLTVPAECRPERRCWCHCPWSMGGERIGAGGRLLWAMGNKPSFLASVRLPAHSVLPAVPPFLMRLTTTSLPVAFGLAVTLALALTGCDLVESGPPASVEGWWDASADVAFDTTFAVEDDPTYRSVAIDFDGELSSFLMATQSEQFVQGSLSDDLTGSGTVRYTRHDGNVVPEPFTVYDGAGFVVEGFYNAPVLQLSQAYGGYGDAEGGARIDFSDGTGSVTRRGALSVRLDRLDRRVVQTTWTDVPVRFRLRPDTGR